MARASRSALISRSVHRGDLSRPTLVELGAEPGEQASQNGRIGQAVVVLHPVSRVTAAVERLADASLRATGTAG
jgi:hypothetical protein